MRRSMQLLVALISTVLSGPSRAATYQFTVIVVHDAGSFFSLRAPAMNEAGQVAFFASDVVYRWDGGAPVPIFETNPLVSGWRIGGVAIDDTGMVYFSTSHYSQIGAQIDAGTGGATQEIFSFLGDHDGFTLLNLVGLVARGDGELAFLAFLDGPTDLTMSILVRDGATFRAAITGVFADLRGPALGANGEVAYWLESSFGEDGVYRAGPTGAPTPIATRGSGIFTCPIAGGCFGQEVGIDDAGNVAFRGFFDTGSGESEEGIFIGDGVVPPSMVVDSSGPFDALSSPHLSHSGELIFEGTLDATPSTTALFTGPDPVADRVFGTGDVLLDSTIFDFVVSGFNDAGQISFLASLANGKTAIVRADPVPEPGTPLGGLTGVATIALLSAARAPARDRRDRRRASPAAVRGAAACAPR